MVAGQGHLVRPIHQVGQLAQQGRLPAQGPSHVVEQLGAGEDEAADGGSDVGGGQGGERERRGGGGGGGGGGRAAAVVLDNRHRAQQLACGRPDGRLRVAQGFQHAHPGEDVGARAMAAGRSGGQGDQGRGAGGRASALKAGRQGLEQAHLAPSGRGGGGGRVRPPRGCHCGRAIRKGDKQGGRRGAGGRKGRRRGRPNARAGWRGHGGQQARGQAPGGRLVRGRGGQPGKEGAHARRLDGRGEG